MSRESLEPRPVDDDLAELSHLGVDTEACRVKFRHSAILLRLGRPASQLESKCLGRFDSRRPQDRLDRSQSIEVGHLETEAMTDAPSDLDVPGGLVLDARRPLSGSVGAGATVVGSGGSASEMLAYLGRSETELRRFLHGLPGVDQVGAESRAASLATRSIKTSAKLWALEMAVRMVDLTTLEGADTPGKVLESLRESRSSRSR